MKYFVCSDIHGSASRCEKVLELFQSTGGDMLVLLGDILYHGPRNDLPEQYAPKTVIKLLNPFAGRIIACRGNCDSEVDQMVLDFPMMSDYSLIVDTGVKIFCTHGHIYAPIRADTSPAVSGSRKIPLAAGSCCVEFYGHTHVQVLEKNPDGVLVCNPGSVSIPKAASAAGFALYENRTVTLYDLNADRIMTMAV
ncbi:MAG: phosphodiesterase [Treponema sp.]|jgi:putative phosphoesterase|nr:phosphodiesterase [Treponema sp.]